MFLPHHIWPYQNNRFNSIKANSKLVSNSWVFNSRPLLFHIVPWLCFVIFIAQFFKWKFQLWNSPSCFHAKVYILPLTGMIDNECKLGWSFNMTLTIHMFNNNVVQSYRHKCNINLAHIYLTCWLLFWHFSKGSKVI